MTQSKRLMFPRLIVGILVTIVIVGVVNKLENAFRPLNLKFHQVRLLNVIIADLYPRDQIIYRKDKAFCSQGHADKGV